MTGLAISRLAISRLAISRLTALNVRIPGICGMGLSFRLDGFRFLYLCMALLMWGVSGAFSREYMAHYQNRSRYYVFFWVTLPATVGVFLSADFFTTFLFFEIMSFTSYVWVAFDERRESLKAAQTYLAVAVIGGMVMLMGLFLLYDMFGTLSMDVVSAEAGKWLASGRDRTRLYLAGVLVLFGFGAKAGCVPLHIWLPRAHPEAPAPASALLSGILTKAGVFGIIAVSCGMFGGDAAWGKLIAVLGLVTMFTGALLALFSVNLKRTLACSSVSQIGFILTGIGMACLLKSAGEDNALAVHGAFLHMLNHSLFKLVLFLCAGAVFMNLHCLDLNDIRGYGRGKPALCFCFLMGALGISGVPLWSGYVSKTLLHEAIVGYAHAAGSGFWRGAEWIFLLTGGMTAAYMLKLFFALFVEENETRQKEFDGAPGPCMKPFSRYPLLGVSLILPILGMLPHLTMDRMADMGQGFFYRNGPSHAVSYFSFGNLKGSVISIGIGVFLYLTVVRGWMMETSASGKKRYVNRWPAWLDLEYLIYRPLLEVLLPGVCGAVCGFVDRYLVDTTVKVSLACALVVCRGMDHAADGVVLAARKTTHSQIPAGQRRKSGAAPGRHMLPERLSRWTKRVMGHLNDTGKLVEESFSFGLMLFCIGLCLTIGYLLFVFWRG